MDLLKKKHSVLNPIILKHINFYIASSMEFYLPMLKKKKKKDIVYYERTNLVLNKVKKNINSNLITP